MLHARVHTPVHAHTYICVFGVYRFGVYIFDLYILSPCES